MGSEHKSKKRGRSTSPAKKKLKRKYRNDRSKKSRQTSSESSSSEEEISLTSDEYPSSGEERRKEAKKKRSKKSKKKSRTSSVSSSRSPTPEKVKKKSKSSKDEKEESRKHKKDRKRSPSKKKHRKSRSEDSESSDSDNDSPIKKENSKKKRSRSPARTKKKKSVSPSSTKEVKKKKRSLSPHLSKKRSSPSSSSRKEKRRSRSLSPVLTKKGRSPVQRKLDDSPIRNASKDRGSPPRSRRKSASPPLKEKKKTSSGSRKESPSPTRHDKSPTNRQKKESPASKKSRSPVPNQRKKESQTSVTGSKSPISHRSKRENESPALKKVGKSPTPDRPKKDSQKESLNLVSHKNNKNSHDKKSEGFAPVQHPLKCPSPTSTSKMLSAKTDVNRVKPVSPGPSLKATKKEDNGLEIKKNVATTDKLKKIDSDGVKLSVSNGKMGNGDTTHSPSVSVNNLKKSDVNVLVSNDVKEGKVTEIPKSEKDEINVEKESIPFLGVSENDEINKPSSPRLPLPPIKPPESIGLAEPIKASDENKPFESALIPAKKENESISLNITSKNKINLNSLSSISLVKVKKTDDITEQKKSGSPSVFRSRKKSPSPIRHRKKSRSPSPSRTRKKSRSSSPIRSRKRSKSPKRDRKRSRSRSPHRYRKDDRNKSPTKQRRRSRSTSPTSRSKKDRDRSPDKKRDKRKDEERDKKDREEKDREKSRKTDDHRRSRDERGSKDDKDRKKKDEKDLKPTKREKSPDKKDINELEEEMKKRKERIEAWRNANRKGDDSINGEENDEEKDQPEKKWSLEDDDDTDEEPLDLNGDENSDKEDRENVKTNKKKPAINSKRDSKIQPKEVANDDDDPLDSFMKGIETEVHKLSGKPSTNTTTTGTKTKTITVVKTVVSTKTEPVASKPEVIEQNQDALEYSSEEETTNDIQASDFVDATKKKKELTVADHSKIYYAPFRRDFYVEVPELARMSVDEVKLLRDCLGDIQVRGKNCPKPIKSWAQAGLSAKMMTVLKKCQYEKPTPIQAQALPIAMSGRDMIGIAKTGSGKTLAFVLPMLRHVLDQPTLDEDDGPIAIIMSPTRELALQIYRESKKFCKALNLQVTCIYGGSGISEQIAELKKGTEIIVCTPGRMIDMLAANNGRVTNCRRCTYLVLDEADRMFDMGFEPQVMRILDNIRPDRQTVLFSATFPRQMEAMARKVLTKPIEVQVGGRSVVCADIEQHAIVIEEDNKFFKILELLGVYQEQGSILLFVERQETADRLFKDLLKKGYPCLSLHGGMDQFDRDSTIADFKNGVTRLMVSTSVAARGLDVKNLNLVVNFDCPNHYEDYVHRVGRTGRAGNKGTAFTFLTPEQGRNAGDIIKAFELSKTEVPTDVQVLWTSYRTEMEKEGKTIKMNSGFSGKGFKFNAEEDAQVNEEKKMRKFTLGLQDSDDEAEAAENAMDKIEADLDKIFSSKPKVALQPEVVEAQKVKVAEQNVDQNKLKQASSIAALINKKLSSGQVMDRNTAATAHIMQGGALESLTGVGLAKQLADKVNAKLNYKAAEVETPVDEKPTLVRYEEEIDINDFPQQARWRITSKEIIEQVRELSEAGVTVRGLYIPPNKKPTEEEKRLHLYIESLSERSIQIAKAEIKRLLKEELIKAESNTYRPTQQTGRYKVV